MRVHHRLVAAYTALGIALALLVINKSTLLSSIIRDDEAGSSVRQLIPEESTEKITKNAQKGDVDLSGGKKNVGGLPTALLRHSSNGLVVVATTDYGYVEMTYNLVLTSFIRFKIENYLIICTHERAALYLKSRGVRQTFLIQNDSRSMDPSYYGTDNYTPKTHVKAEVTLVALNTGLDVVMVDLDVYFFKNPLEYLLRPEFSEYDLLIRRVHRWYNTGFYLARSTPGLVEVFSSTMKHIHNNPKTREHDQQIFNNKLNQKWRKDGNSSVTVHPLQDQQFPIGSEYFNGRRFAGDKPCGDCYIVHNNIIMGYELKRYRFKEHKMWDVDTEGYYSDEDQKYISYENRPGEPYQLQRTKLVTALKLASVLERVLILPVFYCNNLKVKCSFSDRFTDAIFRLDENFAGSYREHLFLEHPRVPKTVKQSQSSVLDLRQLLSQPAGKFWKNTNSSQLSIGEKNISFNDTEHLGAGPSEAGRTHYYFSLENVTELTERSQALPPFSVLHVDGLDTLHLTLEGDYETLLEETITEKKYVPKEKKKEKV